MAANDPAVIKATYTEWRMVKTRNSLILCFEVPLEQQEQVQKALGTPLQGEATWVAIARLREPIQADKPIPAIEAPEKAKQPLRASALAGIMCGEPAFWNYLSEQGLQTKTAEQAATRLRWLCGVASRKALDDDANEGEAITEFHAIRDRYLAWKQVG